MIYVCYFLFALLGIRLLVSIVNYVSFSYLPKRVILNIKPKVSILIPARNEENTIGVLLKQLSSLTYPNLEILVYNDASKDSTAAIVDTWTKKLSKVKLIHGTGLPNGWLGKNHACHQLSLAATGDVLLFLDADVQIKEGLIERSIYHLSKHQLDLLSIFPKQIMKTLGEQVSVPLMNWILLSLLPLPLIRKSKNKAFAAANGQFMMFRTITYKALFPHKMCKANSVEDIAILKLFKEKKYACDTLLGDEAISCRMYLGINDAIEGFTKSIFAFFGNSILVTVTFAVLISVATFIGYFTMGIWGLVMYVIGSLSIRFFVSLASRQSVIRNLLFAFPQHIVFLLIILKGLVNRKQKKLIWKGRNIFQEE